jgi:acetyl esterase/lipase
MNARSTAGQLLVGLATLAVLGGCTGGASPQPTASPPIANPSIAVVPPSSTASAAPTRTPASVTATSNVTYESANPLLVPGELDVFAPAEAGPWPVVVMFHGAPGGNPRMDRGLMSEKARRVADLGFVVFNASWGHVADGDSGDDVPDYDGLVAVGSQAACAVEFARAHANEYGGDPTTMIVFGHSGGAHAAAMAAFARPEPSAGCLGASTLGAIDSLVTWEGNWVLSANVPDWNAALAADPRVMDAATPWTYLDEHRDQEVVMLVSEDPGDFFEREVGDPWAADSWLAVRDPSGDLRRQLEANGAFTDGTLDFIEVQQLLFSVLQAQGNPVSLDVLPDSVHADLLGAGWDVFLAAFPKAAAQD